ncbi:MAG TPA: DUF4233 domain-containing protein [Pilimelia sp.]|nr:DUF4233 domain-containing protein [Pilimelia sp.]
MSGGVAGGRRPPADSAGRDDAAAVPEAAAARDRRAAPAGPPAVDGLGAAAEPAAAGEEAAVCSPAAGPDAPAAAPEEGRDPAGVVRSGLRNPAAAVRGLGAGALVMEAVVLLLAVQPLRVLGGGLGAPALLVVLCLAAAHLLLVGLTGRAWAWRAAAAGQVLLLACGLLHPALGALGVVFGAVWWYLLRVRRTILG